MKNTKQWSNLSVTIKRGLTLIGFLISSVLCIFFFTKGFILSGQTQTMYSISAQIGTEKAPIFENNCTNVHVGDNCITYEKDGVKSTITFPSDVCVKTDICKYESNPSAAHNRNIARAYSFAFIFPVILLGSDILFCWKGRMFNECI